MDYSTISGFLFLGIILYYWVKGRSTKRKSTSHYSFSQTLPSNQSGYDDTISSKAASFNQAGVLLAFENNHIQAIENFSLAIDLKGTDVFYSNRAYSKLAIGKYAGSVRDYNEAIKINPHVALYWLNRGRAFKKDGYEQRALTDWQNAAKLGSEDAKRLLNQYSEPIAQFIPKPNPLSTSATYNDTHNHKPAYTDYGRVPTRESSKERDKKDQVHQPYSYFRSKKLITVFRSLNKGIQRSIIVGGIICSFGLGAMFNIIEEGRVGDWYKLIKKV